MDDVTEEVGRLFVAFNPEYSDRYFDAAAILKTLDGVSTSNHETMRETPELDEEMADFVIEYMQKTQHNDAPYFGTAVNYPAQEWTLSSFSKNQLYINGPRSINDIIDDLKECVTTQEMKNVQEAIIPLEMDGLGTIGSNFDWMTSKSEEELADFAIEKSMLKAQNNGSSYFTSAEYQTTTNSPESVQYSTNQCCHEITELRAIDPHYRRNGSEEQLNANPSEKENLQKIMETAKLDEWSTMNRENRKTAGITIGYMQKRLHDSSTNSRGQIHEGMNDKKAFECPDCKKCFSRNSNLQAHIQTVHKHEKPFECPDCKNCFPKKQNLQTHIQIVHKREKPFECADCKKCFSQKSHLQIHIQTVHKHEKQFECPDCKKCFSQKSSLQTHIQTVHKREKPFECPDCKKYFSRKSSLQKHIQTVHKREKQFECLDCKKCFSQKSNLQSHIQIVHKREKPFECPDCKKCFHGKSHLQIHIQTVHKREKPFECSNCKKCFLQKSHLQIHIQIVHKRAKLFECPDCKKCFSRKSSLQRHIQTVHNASSVGL